MFLLKIELVDEVLLVMVQSGACTTVASIAYDERCMVATMVVHNVTLVTRIRKLNNISKTDRSVQDVIDGTVEGFRRRKQ